MPADDDTRTRIPPVHGHEHEDDDDESNPAVALARVVIVLGVAAAVVALVIIAVDVWRANEAALRQADDAGPEETVAAQNGKGRRRAPAPSDAVVEGAATGEA